ncbi:trypsin-like serine protease, partial [Myxococcota bacterium]|nr:trypsin-like serine protease [Myxococcota bacterium]
MKISSFIPVLFSLSLLACNAEQPPVNSQHKNIMYGTPDTSQAHQAVVYLDLGNSACSGTLITPTWVLTAGHCCETSSIDVYFGNNVNSFTASRSSAQVIQHPNYVGTSQNIYNDICLVRLASSAPSTITPIPILPSSAAISSADVSNLSLVFVGFGVDEYGGSGVKETVTSTLRGQCDGTNYCNIGQVSPYSIPPGSISYLESPGGPCSGDSGGPAFINRSGTEYVAGVTS